jgi:hypothetical protein
VLIRKLKTYLRVGKPTAEFQPKASIHETYPNISLEAIVQRPVMDSGERSHVMHVETGALPTIAPCVEKSQSINELFIARARNGWHRRWQCAGLRTWL